MRKCPQCHERTEALRCPRCGIETREFPGRSSRGATVSLVAGFLAFVVSAAVAVFFLLEKPQDPAPALAESETPSVPAARPLVPMPPEEPASSPPVEPETADSSAIPIEVEMAETEAGDIDRQAFRRVFQQHMGQMRRCYEQELRQQPTLNVKVVVRVTILGSGRVSDVAVSSTHGNDRLDECIRSRIGQWIFPSFHGEWIRISYPLVFRVSG